MWISLTLSGALAAYPDNVVWNITDDVVSVMDDVLRSIRDCSMAMIGIDLVFSIFYNKTFAT